MELTERQKIAHLLRRFGLGASELEMDYYGPTLAGAIEKLLGYASVADDAIAGTAEFQNQQNDNFRPDQATTWWTQRLIRTKRPLQEKMTVFWHDHFATSGVKVNSGFLLADQNEILRRNATGRFDTLLSEVSKDPAMLYFLDNHLNVAGKPNENFAREVMELFTLGIGNYTEKDIQEAARAFTGWSFRKPRRGKPDAIPRKTEFAFVETDHDVTPKTILGQKGNFNGDAVLKMLCDHIQTPRFITKKLWEWFVFANPEPTLVERHAAVFRKSGLNIATLLRSVMESPEFYSDRAYRKLIKNPIDFTIPTVRQIGLAPVVAPGGQGQQGYNGVKLANNRMGMELFAPPDVAGWEIGTAWITSATMVERIKWADRLIDATSRAQRDLIPNLLDSDKPDALVGKLLSVFDVEVDAKKQALMAEAAQKATNTTAAAKAVTRLIFGSPEFQVC